MDHETKSPRKPREDGYAHICRAKGNQGNAFHITTLRRVLAAVHGGMRRLSGDLGSLPEAPGTDLACLSGDRRRVAVRVKGHSTAPVRCRRSVVVQAWSVECESIIPPLEGRVNFIVDRFWPVWEEVVVPLHHRGAAPRPESVEQRAAADGGGVGGGGRLVGGGHGRLRPNLEAPADRERQVRQAELKVALIVVHLEREADWPRVGDLQTSGGAVNWLRVAVKVIERVVGQLWRPPEHSEVRTRLCVERMQRHVGPSLDLPSWRRVPGHVREPHRDGREVVAVAKDEVGVGRQRHLVRRAGAHVLPPPGHERRAIGEHPILL
mmetsp:Transcript_25788/g.54660  ORF Transcript_25788/g.54660 Transcript_25788/m.54660 type:complete len:322 (+) Transcript_25788:298-1263(+)